MGKSGAAILMMFLITTVVIGDQISPTTAAAVTCNAVELSPCANAITSATTTPTPICCSKLKEQTPCLCNYMKNPFLQKFINSPNARKVADTCGTPFPTTCT
ncbi:non-specific lipid-transfer protein 2-like [Apium graveolens]|uniref:non-specific lipid-transfer protein 2-like n=1 Tax=Apium graveolens TaxID=4045 RepID=UPI003D7BB265